MGRAVSAAMILVPAVQARNSSTAAAAIDPLHVGSLARRLNQKGRPKAAIWYQTGPFSSSADLRRPGAGDHDRLAGLDHVGGLGGLAVIGIGASCDPEAGHRDSGYQRHHHDLEVGRTISRVNGVVHLSLPTGFAAVYGSSCKDRLFPDGFAGSAKWFHLPASGFRPGRRPGPASGCGPADIVPDRAGRPDEQE